MKQKIAVGVAALGLLVAFAGCSDDEDSSGDAPSTLSRSQLRSYCAKALRVETFPFPQLGDQPETERPARITEYARELRTLVREAAAAAPAKTRVDLRTVADALEEVVKADGDLTKRTTPAVKAATARAHAFDLANCGWKRVDVAGVEFAFQGLPPSVPAGVVSFELTNKGTFDHVLELYRVNGEDTAAALEFLSGGVPTKEDLAKLTDLGSAFAREGEQGYVVRELEPGRYVAACLIPLNTTPATTHASRGMLAEFEVD